MTAIERRLLWGNLSQIAETTKRRLATKQSHCFVNLYNDWLDIWGGILDAYSKDVLLTSLVVADLFSVGKELHWMHRLLHWGNYPLIHRNLRYVWELMFLAHFADTVEVAVPKIADIPGESVDAKAAWLKRHDRCTNWQSVVRPLLEKVINRGDRRYYSSLWAGLNRSVHASLELRHRLIDESALAVKDAFDRQWAQETCHIASGVFDAIWLLVLRRFPKCIPLLQGKNIFLNAPRSRALVSK